MLIAYTKKDVEHWKLPEKRPKANSLESNG